MKNEQLATEMKTFLVKMIPDLAELWEGATEEEIGQIEKIAEHQLPSFYRWFLSRMGKSMAPLPIPQLISLSSGCFVIMQTIQL